MAKEKNKKSTGKLDAKALRKKARTTYRKVGDQVQKIVPVLDHTGKVINEVVTPIIVEVQISDLVQMAVGAALLSTPVALTQDVWQLGYEMKNFNAFLMIVFSIAFIGFYIYYSFYKGILLRHLSQFIIRVSSTYILSFMVGAGLLSLIGKAPWSDDFGAAMRMAIIVAFPSSMSAAISDSLID